MNKCSSELTARPCLPVKIEPSQNLMILKLLVAIFEPVVNLVIFLRNWRRFVVGAVGSRSGELAGGYELKRRDALNKCH